MRQAWAKFVTNYPAEKENYQKDIKDNTTGDPHGSPLVETIQECAAVIGPLAEGQEGENGHYLRAHDPDNSHAAGGSYFMYNFTVFKTIGLISGLNPKVMTRFQHNAEGWTVAEIANWINGNQDIIWSQAWQYQQDKRNLPPAKNSHPDAGQLKVVVGKDGADDVETTDDIEELYFLSPSVLNYIARKAVSLREESEQTESEFVTGAVAGGQSQAEAAAAGAANETVAGLSASAALYRNLYVLLMKLIKQIDEMSKPKYRKKLVKDDGRNPSMSYSAYKAAADFISDENTTMAILDNPIDSPDNKFKRFRLDKYVRQPAGPRALYDIQEVPGIKDFEAQTLLTPAAQGVMTMTRDAPLTAAYVQWMTDQVEKVGGREGGSSGSLFVDISAAITALIEDPYIGVFAGLATLGTEGAAGSGYKVIRQNQMLDLIMGFFGNSTSPTSHDRGANSTEQQEESGQLARAEPVRQNLVPMDFQCFLLENIRSLSNNHQPSYKYIHPLTTGGEPGLVQNKINKTMDDDEIKAILQMCPAAQALLTPYLKISRVDYNEFNKPIGDPRPLEIPNFLPANIHKDKLLLASNKGRLPGAGIKSFTWSLDGVQPAEVDNNISATLEMYFQSVSDFFNNQVQAGLDDKATYLDLVISSPGHANDNDEDVTVKDAQCKGRVQQALANQYKGAKYRIKVVAGWSDPGTQALQHVMGAAQADALSRALRASKISLFLQQTRHEFKFNQDGSLSLTIEYQASLTGALVGPTADILGPSGAAIADAIKVQQNVVDELKADEERDEEKYKEELEELKKLRGEDRLQKYKKVLANVYESGHVHSLVVNPQEFLEERAADLTPQERAQRAKRKNSTAPRVLVGYRGATRGQTELLDALATAEDSEEAADQTSENMTLRLDALEDDPGSVTLVPFMYLGDLLDAVLAQMEENHGYPLDFLFFLSEVEMIDPLLALQVKNIGEIMKCGQDIRNAAFMEALAAGRPETDPVGAGITQLLNIGDIPISMDAFQVWYKDYIVKKDRDKYYFLHFVKDICAELITRALSSKCFGPDVKFTQRFDAQPIAIHKSSDFTPGRTLPVSFLNKQQKRLKPRTKPRKVAMGMILLATDAKPRALDGHYGTDMKQGVYHHYLGSSCGLVKTINFNREEQPYLRESKIQKAGELGAEQLRELYSADLELHGNNLYKNGQYVYINPRLVGASKDQLTLLGLHGYYLITGVSSTVTENSFNVSVKALHEGIEFGGGNVLLTPEAYQNLRAEAEPHQAPGVSAETFVEPDAAAPAPGSGRSTEGAAVNRQQGSRESAAQADNLAALHAYNPGNPNASPPVPASGMSTDEYLYHMRVGRRTDELGAMGTSPGAVAGMTAAHNQDPYVVANPDYRMAGPERADMAEGFTTGQP